MKKLSYMLAAAVLSFSVLVSCVEKEDHNEELQMKHENETMFLNFKSDVDRNPHSTVMGMHLAQKALNNDMKVVIFFNVGGVHLFLDGMDTLTFHGENLHATLNDIMKKGGKVMACPHCMEVGGVTPEMLPEGVIIGEEPVLIEAIKKSDISFTY